MGRLHVRVQPGARRTGFAGWYGEIPKFAVAAAPVDGAANEQLRVALAHLLDVAKHDVRLVGGATSRSKRFEVDGVDDEALLLRVVALNPRPGR